MAIRSFSYTTALAASLKVVVRDFSTGVERLWNTTLNTGAGGFEAYNAANIANYGISVTEPGSPGTYRWTVPALPATSGAGEYQATTYQIAGANLAVSDLAVGVWLTSFQWSGSAFANVATKAFAIVVRSET